MQRQPAHVVIRHYLQDAIAAEEAYEAHLRGFMNNAARQPEVQLLFRAHAEETRRQVAWLKMRLETLGGAVSGVRSFLAQLAGMGPKLGHAGLEETSRVTQDLMAAYTAECNEIAFYDALAVAAATAGDEDTERLARGIQAEERRAAERIWNFLAPSA